jgi:hypothetical protein
MRRLWQHAERGGHRPFLVALAVGLVVRALALAAYWPGFVRSDGPTYLAISESLFPSPDRVVGYSAALRALSWVDDSVALISITQHLLGLVTAVLLYALLRRRGCGPWVATLATLPVLLDGMQLVLEQSVLSDELYQLLLVGAAALLLWRPRPRLVEVALAGLVLGLSVLVRVGGEPAVLSAVLLVVMVGRGWRTKLLHVVLVAVTFAAPVLAYASWYRSETGAFALTQSGGRALYMRTTSFVDCSQMTVPSYERTLCPQEPVGQRLDPTWYGWHDPDGHHGLNDLPDGLTPDQVMRDFAMRAIRAQPGGYAWAVGRDVLLTFDTSRGDRYGYDTAHKWRFDGWYGYRPTQWTGPAYLGHGGVPPRTTGPLARVMSRYGTFVYLWGPLLAVLLVLGMAGLFRRRRDHGPDQRPAVLLLLTLGCGLVLVPDLTAQFVWRYTLPMMTLVPPAAALAWVQLRARPTWHAGDTEHGLAEGRDDAALERPGDRDDEAVVDRDESRVR